MQITERDQLELNEMRMHGYPTISSILDDVTGYGQRIYGPGGAIQLLRKVAQAQTLAEAQIVVVKAIALMDGRLQTA
jgi:hypothetical protein